MGLKNLAKYYWREYELWLVPFAALVVVALLLVQYALVNSLSVLVAGQPFNWNAYALQSAKLVRSGQLDGVMAIILVVVAYTIILCAVQLKRDYARAQEEAIQLARQTTAAWHGLPGTPGGRPSTRRVH